MGRKFSQEDFINKAKIIHNNKYDYSKTIYKNKRTNVIIICPEHGSFFQTPYEHKKGSGCPYCFEFYKTNEDFISSAKKVHGDKYDYSKVNFLNVRDKVDDIFNSIGDFPYCEYKKFVLLNDWYKLSNFNYKDRAGIGNYIIKHFHKNIYTSNVFGKPSPVEAWSNESIMKRTIKNRLPITPEKIKQGLNVTKLTPKVSVFNPNLAKRIASTYLKEFNVVFDPFSGFSGRMLGVCASNKKYIGQDINKESINASNEIINLLSLNASVIEKDIFNSKGEYECLFTCPPYNLKEILNQDIKNLSCDEWIKICLDNFKCKKYIFVVDNTILFKDNIIEELNNKSHFSSNKEYIILIEGKDE